MEIIYLIAALLAMSIGISILYYREVETNKRLKATIEEYKELKKVLVEEVQLLMRQNDLLKAINKSKGY